MAMGILGLARWLLGTRRRAWEREEAHFGGERFSGFFNQVLVGVAQTDLEGRFLAVNSRFCEITGRSQEELLCLRM
jgi:PAS domain-containing protein